MGLALKVSFVYYEIGTGSFLHSFFSTISHHLEGDGWGSKYPLLLNDLYQGKIAAENVSKAKAELLEVRKELKQFAPDQVIWDIEDLSKQPPWGNKISKDITDLSNYFVTSDGRDLFDVMLLAFSDAEEAKLDVEITQM